MGQTPRKPGDNPLAFARSSGYNLAPVEKNPGKTNTMEVTQTIDKARFKKEKAKEAIDLALKGCWQEAVHVNRQILQMFPDDIESLNRLGKALVEMGQHAEAREAFEATLRLSPHNAIAKKNLERLKKSRGGARQGETQRKLAPQRFVEESGRSGVTVLAKVAPLEVLGKVSPGDGVDLELEGNAIVVKTTGGSYLGQVEPKLATRLSRLMRGGNRYEGAVVSVSPEQVAVLLVETFRHPDMEGMASFPTRNTGDYRSVFQDTVLEYSMEDDEDGDEQEPGPDDLDPPFVYSEDLQEMEAN